MSVTGKEERPERWPSGWWALCRSQSLGSRRPLGLQRLGQRLVLWRDDAGVAHLARAGCPHRGTDLSMGRLQGGDLLCPYHGFRFGSDGACKAIPCEGSGAKIPPRLRLSTFPVQEAHGFLFGYLGQGEPSELPWLDDAPEPSSSEGQRDIVWPVRLSRAVEAMLDIHHLAVAHPIVGLPRHTRLDPFEAHVDERGFLRSSGLLRREDRPESGLSFRMDLAPPAQLCLRLTALADVVVCCTPVDEESTWMGMRYRVRVPYLSSLPLVDRIASEIAVLTELWLVQPDDLRMVGNTGRRTLSLEDSQLVHADKAIALWHAWQQRATRERPENGRDDEPRPLRAPASAAP